MSKNLKNKFKKAKYVTLKELSTLYTLQNANIPFAKIDKLNYYKLKKDGVGMTMDIFNPKGHININKIKWVKLTVKEKCVDKINLNNYKYNGIKVKKVKPEYTSEFDQYVGVIMPVEIFKAMLNKYSNVTSPYRLSHLLNIISDPFAIKLLNADKKLIAYALEDPDTTI